MKNNRNKNTPAPVIVQADDTMVSSSGQTKVRSYFKPKAKRGRRFKVGSKSGRKTKGKDAETADEQQLRKEAAEFDSKLPDNQKPLCA